LIAGEVVIIAGEDACNGGKKNFMK